MDYSSEIKNLRKELEALVEQNKALDAERKAWWAEQDKINKQIREAMDRKYAEHPDDFTLLCHDITKWVAAFRAGIYSSFPLPYSDEKRIPATANIETTLIKPSKPKPQQLARRRPFTYGMTFQV